MNTRQFAVRAAFVAVLAILSITTAGAQKNPFLGRWNITPTGDNAGVYWLEVKEDGGQLTGMFLNRGGSPVKLPSIKMENGELVWQTDPPARGGAAPEFRARAQGDKLTGSVKMAARTRRIHRRRGRPSGAPSTRTPLTSSARRSSCSTARRWTPGTCRTRASRWAGRSSTAR